MDLHRAIILQDLLEPLGSSRKIWRAARDVTWAAIQPFISRGDGPKIRDYDLREVARGLEIGVDDLKKIVSWAREGHYPESLASNCAFGRFWIAPVDPPPCAAEAEKPKVRNAEDLRANFRRRI